MRFAASFVAVLILAGCGGDDDAATEATEAPGVAISLVPSGEIDIDLAPVILPDGYPEAVPLPEFVLESAERLDGATSTIYDITGWYDGDPIRAARDYIAALEDVGFEVDSRTETPDNYFFTAAGGEWFVSAGFFPDPVREVGTSVGVTVAPVDAMAPDT